MPSTRSVAVAALYVLYLAGTLTVLIAASLDDETASATLILIAAALIVTTCRMAALNRFRTHGADQ